MSSLGRMLSTLDLFTESEPTRTIDEMIADTGFKRATLYRYVRELGKAGLLVRITGSLYTLGPRFIEIDRQIRMSDPLLKAGHALVSELCERSGKPVILCSLLRDSVVCIDLQRSLDLPSELGHERGRPMPLFISANAKAILASLPSPRLRRLFQNRKTEIRAAGLGRTWDVFKAKLRAIRRSGYAESHGELIAGLVGIAVPVFNGAGDVLGSLALVIPESEVDERSRAEYVAMLSDAGDRLNRALAGLAASREASGSEPLIPLERSRRRTGMPPAHRGTGAVSSMVLHGEVEP